MADLNGLKRYAAVNDETDEALLTETMQAAIRALEAAGVAERFGDSLYDLAVYQLATHWFDRRGVVMENGAAMQIPLGLQGIVHQLRYEPGAN